MPLADPISAAWNTVARFDDYESAQRAVDRLSDDGFPVEKLDIVGSGLRLVERVTGRLTRARAATAGALSGLWAGLLFGILLGLFTSGHSLPRGRRDRRRARRVWGAAFGFVAHARTKGQRDFSSVRQLVATRYDLIAREGTVERARYMLGDAGLLPEPDRRPGTLTTRPPRHGRWPAVTVPLWAWAAFLAFVVAMLVLDLFVLHRRAHEVSLREAGAWSAVWIVVGLGFGGLVWAWAGGGGRPGLPGRVPDREEPVGRQHLRVRRHLRRARHPGALPAPGAHVRHRRRAAHAGRVHRRRHRPARGHPPGHLRLRRDPARGRGQHAARRQSCRAVAGEPRVLRVLRRVLPVNNRLHGQRFVVSDGRPPARHAAAASPWSWWRPPMSSSPSTRSRRCSR